MSVYVVARTEIKALKRARDGESYTTFEKALAALSAGDRVWRVHMEAYEIKEGK